MFLKALEIQGFKSFPDRTRMVFDRGVTAVVGPNGSGKSNISDAIRWVLGETSVRQLRGGAKMENVIFGGTPRRGAMGYASVRLVVDNTDRRIDVDSDEVVIGRKYYRSGDSEYTVNGQNVRLRDIYEMFLDTGLGRDGYSAVGQGRIAEIVGAKSAERREIFEEASGVARYRYRKNEAERRLASAEENLVRLRDILRELTGRVEPLEQESKKAKQFLELAGRRRTLEVTLWTDALRQAADAVRGQQRRLEIAGAEYERAERDEKMLDGEMAETRALTERLIAEADRCATEIRALTEKSSGADAEIAVLQNDIAHNDAAIETLQEEKNRGGAGREAIEAEIARRTDELRACEESGAALAQRARACEEELEALRRSNEAQDERRGALTARLNELSVRATEEKVCAASAQSAAQSAAEQLAAAQAERTAGEENERALLEQKTEAEAFLRETAAQITRLENIQKGLAMKLESRRRALEQAVESEQAAARALDAAQQRLGVLREWEHSMDGFQNSVKAVLKAARAGRLRGVIGPVSAVITVQAGYEVAIETALGYALQNIVVEDENAAKAAIAFLRDEQSGRATFLPLDTVKPASSPQRLPEGAVLADSLVHCDEKYARIVSNLLGRIVVVEDLDDASRVARALEYRFRVVTVDGQIINAGGSFTGGSVSRSAGLFSRRQEIEELGKQMETLRRRREEAARKAAQAKAETDALAAELAGAESEAVTAGGDKIRGEMECTRLANAVRQAQEAHGQLDETCTQLIRRIAQEREHAENARKTLTALTAESEALEEQLRAAAGSSDTFSARRTELAETLSDLKLQALAAGKDAENCRAAIAQLQSRTGEHDARVREIEEETERLTALNKDCAARIEAVRAGLARNKEEIARREADKAEAVRRRMEQEGAAARQTARMREISDEREKLGRELARLTEQKEQRDAESAQMAAKLWEEYELTPSQAEPLCAPFENIADIRRETAEVRAKIRALGSVNVGAIEEYEEVHSRYEFLRGQVRDVETSKAELQKMIAGLADEMRAMFRASFTEINGHFGRIFAQLFGGGTAQLYLEDETDVLESGIGIEVSPPGKLIRDLSALSGGEQALVAISIYFAIFAVNPTPFCVLDEIEAALDDVNVVRFAQYLRRITDHTQFILITHRRGTMENADVLYGVTMQEDGVSKLLRLDMEHVDASLVS